MPWLQKLQERCKTCSRVTIVLGIFFVGMLFTGVLLAAGAAGLAWTNTEEFCISCHEMRAFPYEEYKETIHASNRTGVRAVCTDCHVPRDPGPMLIAKVKATKDLWGHMIGKIDTEEKFQELRSHMAQNVWRRMKSTDSLECRNCHKEKSWSPELQSEKSKARHAKGKAEGKTCIDCHYGIAHNEPEGPGPQELFGPNGEPLTEAK